MEFLPSTPLVETQGYTKPQAVTSGKHPIPEEAGFDLGSTSKLAQVPSAAS